MKRVLEILPLFSCI
jgi:hypothetical protein